MKYVAFDSPNIAIISIINLFIQIIPIQVNNIVNVSSKSDIFEICVILHILICPEFQMCGKIQAVCNHPVYKRFIKKIPPEGGIKGQKLKIIRINNNPQQLSKDIKIFI